jgi:uncharacterized membrane protein
VRHHGPSVAPPERDPRLDRLIALSDGVFAIALTLLVLELALPGASANLHGRALTESILATWPTVLAYLTSFAVIGIFWQGHNQMFQHLERYDGGLMWLAFLQLACVAFLPFPTSVLGEHGGDGATRRRRSSTGAASSLPGW